MFIKYHNAESIISITITIFSVTTDNPNRVASLQIPQPLLANRNQFSLALSFTPLNPIVFYSQSRLSCVFICVKGWVQRVSWLRLYHLAFPNSMHPASLMLLQPISTFTHFSKGFTTKATLPSPSACPQFQSCSPALFTVYSPVHFSVSLSAKYFRNSLSDSLCRGCWLPYPKPI